MTLLNLRFISAMPLAPPRARSQLCRTPEPSPETRPSPATDTDRLFIGCIQDCHCLRAGGIHADDNHSGERRIQNVLGPHSTSRPSPAHTVDQSDPEVNSRVKVRLQTAPDHASGGIHGNATAEFLPELETLKAASRSSVVRHDASGSRAVQCGSDEISSHICTCACAWSVQPDLT